MDVYEFMFVCECMHMCLYVSVRMYVHMSCLFYIFHIIIRLSLDSISVFFLLTPSMLTNHSVLPSLSRTFMDVYAYVYV